MADEMPPKHPLGEEEKAMLREWIAAGATWGSSPIDRFRFSSEGRAGYDWWAVQPLAAPPCRRSKTGSGRSIRSTTSCWPNLKRRS